MIKHVPTPAHLKPKPEDIDLYARALALSHAPRQIPLYERLLNYLYWAVILAAMTWVAGMVIDREPPVRVIAREVANPGRQVRIGERLLIRSARERTRQCELTRRWWLVDRGDAAGARVRDPAAGADAVNCPAPDQDLSAVVALACLLVGLIVGGVVAARGPP
ncbi:hypothetical protein [Methylobacterium gregans]|uniref:Uncharacterized protein n=1 Tax=Methylobacterium gregans TaxID=374424 RepID=A0AA37HK15_9HYPH|nr:hypothetical protein [Methylobacterium gregans]MDQ0520039.1 hypothetical protein [Methylobacterium gregans]GJD77018.1 hypothetical protein NBEOAGPD_0219 [Methylobacterium gregans]GLS52439.1 hypothetical protein GCM10007886_06220 [Methylobacterium gregans]